MNITVQNKNLFAMKKTTVVNLITICCLLVLCITTLIVIYATAPETSVVLFEDHFNSLDESKWAHESAECKEDSEVLQYTTESDENRYSTDGALHFFINHTEDGGRTKRKTQSKCNTCINWQNGAVHCFPSKYSARFRTKAQFDVERGQIEVRSRLPTDHWIKLTISMSPVKNDSEEQLGGFVVSKMNERTGRNCSADVEIFFGLGSNHSFIKSVAADNEFHTYKMEWNSSEIFFAVDGRIMFEKTVEAQGADENPPINQPFFLQLGVDMGESDPSCHRERKRSLADSPESSAADVDYFKLNEIP